MYLNEEFLIVDSFISKVCCRWGGFADMRAFPLASCWSVMGSDTNQKSQWNVYVNYLALNLIFFQKEYSFMKFQIETKAPKSQIYLPKPTGFLLSVQNYLVCLSLFKPRTDCRFQKWNIINNKFIMIKRMNERENKNDFSFQITNSDLWKCSANIVRKIV